MARDLSSFLEEVVFIAEADDAGTRLDHFLGDHIFWRSRTDLQNRVKSGRVELNGAAAKCSARLKTGDRVRVSVTPEDLPDQDPAAIEVRVLREDAHLVAVDKQPGLVVHPTGRHVYDTLMNALFLRYRRTGELERGVVPHVVHRLDRNTSGVLIVAKSFEAKQLLQAEFEARRPRKEYLALVEGRPERDRGLIEGAIARDETAEIRLKMAVVPDGLPSATDYEVVERFEDHALVRARPRTGRQHQIRVHLASIGHPIVADPLYGDPRTVGHGTSALLNRQALHAERLTIAHPDGETMVVEAPLSTDIARVCAHLRAGGSLTRLADDQSSRWRRA